MKILRLLFQQGADVNAGGPGAADGDDVLDLGEAETQAAGPPNEGQRAEHCFGVHAIPRGCPTRSGQDPPPLINQKRLAAESASGRDLPDPQSLCHAVSLQLAPRGRVKWKFGVARRRHSLYRGRAPVKAHRTIAWLTGCVAVMPTP